MGLLDPPAYSRSQSDARYVTAAQVGKRSIFAAKAAAAKAPVTAATLPTITAGTPTTQGSALTVNSAITGAVAFPFGSNQSKFFIGGGPAYTSGSAYYQNNLIFQSDGVVSLWRIEWMTDSPDFEFAIRDTNGGAANHRLMVEGDWVNSAVSGGATGNRISYRVNYGTRTARKYTLWIENLSFGGVVLGPNDSLWAPSGKATRVMFFGDSYTLGTGATRFATGFAAQAAQLLGFDDPYFNGVSGTGYVRQAGSGSRKFQDRIADSITPYAPDLLVVMGGYNDNTANLPTLTASALQTAASNFYAALATAMPNMPVVVFGKQTSRTPGAEDISFSDAIKTAAQAAPNVKRFVDLVSTPWISGTGKVGATTGSGNADVLISSDGAHPSQAGHDYFARRVVDEIATYLLTPTT